MLWAAKIGWELVGYPLRLGFRSKKTGKKWKSTLRAEIRAPVARNHCPIFSKQEVPFV